MSCADTRMSRSMAAFLSESLFRVGVGEIRSPKLIHSHVQPTTGDLKQGKNYRGPRFWRVTCGNTRVWSPVYAYRSPVYA
jgi:hypothetical protein